MKSDIGIIGLGVMGENLALNMESKGFTVSVYNRTVSKVDKLINGRGKGKRFIVCQSLEDLVASLNKPRKVMLMIKAGKPVDFLIEALIPLLDQNDIIIDGGNSDYRDTERRVNICEEHELHFVGMGISGGAKGALEGPSIMPGGSFEAWSQIKEIFQSIAAKIDGSVPCCDWIGPRGAGHFVKTVHNGIEYGEMQLICEVFHIMKALLNLPVSEIQSIFEKWNKGVINSFLIDATTKILEGKDKDGSPIIDKILDAAGQKGTGKWAVEAALEFGVPVGVISGSVFARFISAMKDERVHASKILSGPEVRFTGDKTVFIRDLEKALYFAKIVLHAQGFQLMKEVSKELGWKLDLSRIAQAWKGGCIIRSALLKEMQKAFDGTTNLASLMLAPYFSKELNGLQERARSVLSAVIANGIPVPGMSSAISYFDSYRSEKLPANLLQAQRDFFGAHMYERVDKPRGEFFHTDW